MRNDAKKALFVIGASLLVLGGLYVPISSYAQTVGFFYEEGNYVEIPNCVVKKYLIGGVIATIPDDMLVTVDPLGTGTEGYIKRLKWNEAGQNWEIYSTYTL